MAFHRPTYAVYRCMLSRCYDERNKSFRYYGGKGVIVCQRWKESYLNFLKDMGERPAGTSIDREDSAGNYAPSNCRWANKIEQRLNQSNTLLITIGGKTNTMTGWAKEKGVSPVSIHYRIKKLGIDPEVALLMPSPSRKTRHTINWKQIK